MDKKKYNYSYEKVVVPKALKNEFTTIAKKKGVCKSDVIRNAITQFIRDSKK